MSAIINATDQDFDTRVLKGGGLVLVDFWADWCGPCKVLAPTLADIADDFEEDLEVVKVDIVANPVTAERYGVRSIPLLVLFRDGTEIDRILGAVSRSKLMQFVEAQLA